MKHPWQRQKRESARAFEAFQAYRDMGPSRSLAKVGEELGKSDTLIERWSSKYRWVERARAWDEEQDDNRRVKHSKGLEEMAERHIKLSLMLQNQVAQTLAEMTTKTNLIPSGVVQQWMDTAVRIERLARGQATERTETREVSTWQDLMEYADSDEETGD